jgi:hypothetical protein
MSASKGDETQSVRVPAQCGRVGISLVPRNYMQVIGYSSDELKHLARIISDVIGEAQMRRSELSTDEFVQRVCGLSGHAAKEISRSHGMLS